MPHDPKSMMILIAGPYRSGTGDDPAKILKNLRNLEAHALPLYRAGHLPVIGEWLSLPLIRAAGGKCVDDAIHEEFLYPAAKRLFDRCDAVLRIPGESRGADQEVRMAKERGMPVFFRVEDVPIVRSEERHVG